MEIFINLLCAIFVGVIIGRVIILIVNSIKMYRDADLHYWPSEAHCPLCEKRIWIWQSFEYRKEKVNCDNPDGVVVAFGASCLVHKKCKGTPVCEIGVRLG